MIKGTICDSCGAKEATKFWLGGQPLCDECYEKWKIKYGVKICQKETAEDKKEIVKETAEDKKEIMKETIKDKKETTKDKKEKKKESGQMKLF